MILELIKKRRATILIAAALSGVQSFLTILIIAFLNQLASSGSTQSSLNGWQIAVLLGCALASGIASNACLARLGSGAIGDLRRQLSELFLGMSYEEQAQLGSNRVTSTLITDVQQLSTFIILLPTFFFHLLTLLFCLGYLMLLSWKIFAGFAAAMVVLFGVSTIMQMLITARYRELRAEEDKLYEYFNVLSQGKKELALNPVRADHFLDERIRPRIDSTQRRADLTHRAWGYWQASSVTLHLTAMLSVTYFGALLFAEPAEIVQRSLIVALFAMGPVMFLVDTGRQLAFSSVSVRRLRALGLEMKSPPPRESTHGSEMSWTRIAMHDVEYRYDDPGSSFVLGPVSLSFGRGEVIFITGGNGSGKSTLALLLISLIRPSAGHIAIDGAPLTPDTVSSYRRLFSMVFFDFHLFADVIDRAGLPANARVFGELLLKLGLHGKVELVDGRLTTLDLSQGQRRRLALAQSHVEDPDVFMFDEWAADQDPEYKRYFYLELLPELRTRGKTVVAITHDDHYFNCADRIVKMEQGSIVFDGRPEHLARVRQGRARA